MPEPSDGWKPFLRNVSAILAVMIPLVLVLVAYMRATGANDDAAHDEKMRQLMFSSLPTKPEVQAHWAAQDVAEAAVLRRLDVLEAHEREDHARIAALEAMVKK